MMDADNEREVRHLLEGLAAFAANLSDEDRWQLVGRLLAVTGEIRLSIGSTGSPQAGEGPPAEDGLLARAPRELYPKLRQSAMAVLPIGEGDPPPQTCMEVGAAILLDKPILVMAPAGVRVPLALRTIAHKIVEVDEADDAGSKARLAAAMKEVLDTLPFRGK